ncbi:MAG: hypothetical protein J0H15_11035 [Xanthomonadales bacterium]|nr:hypothetical protein [Xanthomonadales bacterium]
MQQREEAQPGAPDPAGSATLDVLAAARDAAVQTARVATAAWGVLRAELRLAKTSAGRLVVFGLLALVLAGSAWLAILATIAVALYQLTHSLLIGVGAVALANVLGVAWLALLLRSCARDLDLPHTRRILAELSDGEP